MHHRLFYAMGPAGGNVGLEGVTRVNGDSGSLHCERDAGVAEVVRDAVLDAIRRQVGEDLPPRSEESVSPREHEMNCRRH